MTRPTTTGKAQDLITFTRSTTGTALAKISYGEELVTNGTFDDGTTGWSKSNAASSIAAVNNQLVVTLGSTYNNTYTSIATEAGKAYTASVNLISSTSDAIYIGAGPTGNSFSLGLSSDIYDGTKGTITFTASGSVTFIQLHVNGSSGQQATFDNVSVKEVLYDQPDGTLQLFNHPINKPRIEYDASGNCLGLLMEEARTNLALNSVNASSDNAATNITQVANKANSLTGADDAFLLQANTAGASYTGQLTTVTSGTSYTASRFAKAGASNFAQLSMGTGGFGSAVFANFDLNTGTVSQESNCAAVMTNMGSGWYRCSISKQAVATTFGTSPHYFSAVNSGTANARISEAGNSVYFYGAQTETGAFPTSYIPTSGSAVTRADDLASLAVSKFGYNQDQGSVVVESNFFGGTNTNTLCYIGEDTSDRILFYYSNKNLSFQVKSSGATQATKSLSGQRNKAAYRYKLNDMNLAGNGDTTVADTSANLLGGTQNNIYIGSYYNGGSQLNGHIKSIKYYPVGLSNAQLQALTV